MRSLILVVGLLMSQAAFADFIFEPSILGSMGSMKGTTLTDEDITPTETTGYGGGLKIGFNISRFFIAADGTMATGKAKVENVESDFTLTNIGVIAGFYLSRGRIYVGYAPSSTYLEKSDDGNESKLTGSSMKVGLSYFLIPRTSLNLEYVSHSFKKQSTNGGAETEVSDAYGSLKYDPIMLSLAYTF